MPRKSIPKKDDEKVRPVCRACGGTGRSSRGGYCVCVSNQHRQHYYPDGLLPSNTQRKGDRR